MNPIISIIIPVYNAEKTLNRCVDSVLNQTFHDWELLLIDDGSKDRSMYLCDEYALKDKRIKVFHKKNGGVSSARNMGLDYARGEWITFVDSDDYICENIFDLVSSHNEDLLIFNYVINNNGTTRCGKSIPIWYNSYPIKTILNKYIYIDLLRTPWSKFFKRSIINTLRFDNRITIGEDTLFVLQYLQKCKSLFLFEQKYYIWSYYKIKFKSKYNLNVEQAVYTITCLYSEYKSLNIRCTEFEKFIYDLYYYLCEDNLIKDGIIWFNNKTVIQLWERIKYLYSFKIRFLFILKRYKVFFYLLRLYHLK